MTGLKTMLFDFLVDINVSEVIANITVTILSIAVWILVGIILQLSIRHLLYKVLKLKRKGARAITIGKLSSSISKYFIWFIIGMVILGELNVDVTPFIASAGVIGLAIGFGAQEIVKDFISGFFIIFEESFNVDDVVEIDGFKGNILSLGLRTTRIINWKGEVKIINNGNIKSIINYSRSKSVAIVEFGVAYDTDLLKFQELMAVFVENAYLKYDEIIETPIFSGITELADSSINMRLLAKTNSQKHFQVGRDIRRDLVIYLTENEVEIPFPQLVIYNEKN
ncbi:MAG: mechanosensitive ion channel family protein [Candidatus Izimaplasma sp.]|nr:mechanosensitive ion channel family protein [Candidatus Izimaplasma bacterium]